MLTTTLAAMVLVGLVLAAKVILKALDRKGDVGTELRIGEASFTLWAKEEEKTDFRKAMPQGASKRVAIPKRSRARVSAGSSSL